MENLPKSFYEIFNQMKTIYPENTAIRYYENELVEKTYREYHDDIRRFIAYLMKSGVKSRSHIAILSKNSYSYAVAIHAIILFDCVVVPLNPDASQQEIRQLLETADVSVLLCDDYSVNRNDMSLPEFGCACLDIRGYLCCDPVEVRDLCQLDKLCMILFTSGTTGQSKGVMFNQKNILAALNIHTDEAVFTMASIGMSGYRVNQITFLPLYHIAAMMEVIECAFVGSIFSLCLDVRNIFRDLNVMKSHFIVLPPVMIEFFLKRAIQSLEIVHDFPIICSAASAANRDVMMELQKRGVVVKQLYAMTETFGVGTFDHRTDNEHEASVGVGSPYMEYSIIDEEICMRGKCVMMGYYKDPDATKAAIDENGWFHTGDLGRIDEDGFFYITGRKKNLIILSNGENVSPEELEQLLKKLDQVEDVLVYEKDGKICAMIYCSEMASRDEVNERVHKLNQTLPRFKQISLVEFTDDPIERSALGKEKRKNGKE